MTDPILITYIVIAIIVTFVTATFISATDDYADTIDVGGQGLLAGILWPLLLFFCFISLIVVGLATAIDWIVGIPASKIADKLK